MSEVSEASDEDLTERARNGDTDAYRELWERHSRAGRTAARSFARIADPDDLVSEAFLQILRAIQRGGGPREAFRPYLYRTIRNLALNRRHTDVPVSLDAVAELPAESGDPETTVMENTVTVRAFRTLPERWQTVLWYTEVEGLEPAEAAPFLGLSANGAAALAYRAREGLRKAWLQAHVSSLRVPAGCQWTTQRMSDYVRGDLSPRARERFDNHLKDCTRCSILLEEIDDVGRRLAVVLFPIVLGSAAAASLLAATGKASDAAVATAAPREPASATMAGAAAGSTRHGVLIAAATAGVLAIGLAAAAASGVFNAPPTDGPQGPPPDAQVAEPTTRPTPDPTQTPEPSPPPPPPPAPPVDDPTPPTTAPPVQPPVQPPAPPPPVPDVTAPAAASIATPVDGALGNDPRPAITGSGEPNARVEIERIAGPGPAGAILTTPVPADGLWSVMPTEAFGDGIHTLRITQVDAAGNRSAPVEVDLTIDTIALPPTVTPVAGPQLYLPTLTGTAEPLATIELEQPAGTAIGTVVAAADGSWSFVLPDPGPVDATVIATQTDQAGNRSVPSAAEPITLLRPEITVPADGASVPSTGGATAVEVRFGGVPDERVEVLIDGVPTGNIHTLTDTPLIRTTAPLADGVHTIAVRYIDPDTGAIGSLSIITFTIG